MSHSRIKFWLNIYNSILTHSFDSLRLLEFYEVLCVLFGVWVRDRESFEFIVQSISINLRASPLCMNCLIIREPFMLKCLLKWWPLLSIFLQKFFHEVLCIRC